MPIRALCIGKTEKKVITRTLEHQHDSFNGNKKAQVQLSIALNVRQSIIG